MSRKGFKNPQPLIYKCAHQCFEYEQQRPFLFNDMQMGSDILNFLLVDHRVSCTQSFDRVTV